MILETTSKTDIHWVRNSPARRTVKGCFADGWAAWCNRVSFLTEKHYTWPTARHSTQKMSWREKIVWVQPLNHIFCLFQVNDLSGTIDQNILLMEEILHQLICSLSHYLQALAGCLGFLNHQQYSNSKILSRKVFGQVARSQYQAKTPNRPKRKNASSAFLLFSGLRIEGPHNPHTTHYLEDYYTSWDKG